MKFTSRTKLNIAVVTFAMVSGIVISSCADKVVGPNEIGGDTNISYAQVGSTFGMYVSVNGTTVPLKDTMYVTKNDNGIVTLKVKAETAGNPLSSVIPADLKDSTGNINADLRFKITSEGIQEYYNGGNDLNRPFTIVKHDGVVGDRYEFTRTDGKHVVRTITEKTGVDEWPLGFYLIKTAATEESPTALEGVTKVIYRTNHKFGLVYIEWQLTNGTVVKLNLMPWAAM